MSANVVVIRDAQEWEVISKLLSKLRDGGIIVPPEHAEYLDEQFPGWEDHLEEPIDYDFGGNAPDISVDIALDNTFAASELDEHLIAIQERKRDES